VKTNAKIFSPTPDQPFGTRNFAPTNTSFAFWSPSSNDSRRPDDADPDSGSLIYAVDDMACLTELYALVLEASGHSVRGFNDRRAALAALKSEREKPALLITDYRNVSMPLDRFLQECVASHPSLRILMATGFGHNHAWFSAITPDRFLQKPFTPEELQKEVRAALAEVPTVSHAKVLDE
jgi:DNA-binding NtrC family response regulator